MSRIIHARLDEETDRLRRELERTMGWSDSEIVRAGIKTLACIAAPGERRIIGLGAFRSDVSDLGANKKHLEGFGR